MRRTAPVFVARHLDTAGRVAGILAIAVVGWSAVASEVPAAATVAAEEAKLSRERLGRVAGVAREPVVSGHSTSAGYVAWVTLEIDLAAPAKLKGRKLFIVSSEDIAVRAGDTVECDLSGTPVSRRRDGAYEVAMVGVKDFQVKPPPPSAAPQPPPKNAK